MRVQGTSSAAAGGARSVRRSQTAGGFRVASGAAGGPSGTGSASALASIDALLALQGIDGPDAAEARCVDRGHDLLDGLRTLQRDVLAGQLDRETLEDLRNRLARDRGTSRDPALAAILRDIDVRAAVELAKLGAVPAVARTSAPAPMAAAPRRALLGAYAPVRLDG